MKSRPALSAVASTTGRKASSAFHVESVESAPSSSSNLEATVVTPFAFGSLRAARSAACSGQLHLRVRPPVGLHGRDLPLRERRQLLLACERGCDGGRQPVGLPSLALHLLLVELG